MAIPRATVVAIHGAWKHMRTNDALLASSPAPKCCAEVSHDICCIVRGSGTSVAVQVVIEGGPGRKT
eukprot:8815617-Pyramimonas_sp.AAC.1